MYPSLSKRAFRAIAGAVVSFQLSGATAWADRQHSSDTAASEKTAETRKIYEPGGDVKRPKLLHYVEPEFSTKSKEAFVEGTVKISTVVSTDGLPTASQVLSGLNAEEDRTALEALKQWKFQPGTKSGQPVNVRVTVEIAFHLL